VLFDADRAALFADRSGFSDFLALDLDTPILTYHEEGLLMRIEDWWSTDVEREFKRRNSAYTAIQSNEELVRENLRLREKLENEKLKR
jgi:hypothetical protein